MCKLLTFLKGVRSKTRRVKIEKIGEDRVYEI